MAEENNVESVAKPRAAKSDAAPVINGLYVGEAERTFQESAYHPDSFAKPYNPDPLVRSDYTYGLYEDMVKDDQVNVALNLKKDLVVGSGWYLSCNDENIKIEMESLLSDEPDRPFTEMLRDILQSYQYGFSVSEKIFKVGYKGLLTIKDIKPRHPSTWTLHTDQHGNITRYEQNGPMGSIDANPLSLIHYVNEDMHQNPYGRSDLYSAHQAWITKRHITRFYAIFLEGIAGPKPVASYDVGVPEEAVTAIYEAIKKFQTKTALAIPKDIELEFLEPKNGGDAYIKGINLFNMFIGRALFIPDLLGFSGGETGGGSFSLGQEQIGLFFKHIYRRRSILEALINKHIIKPMYVYNYGIPADNKYPVFKFNPLSDEDANKQADLWIKGVQGVGWAPTIEEVNHFRRLVKFPESDEMILKAQMLAEQMGENQSKDGSDDEDSKDESDFSEEQEETKEPEKKEFALRLDELPGAYKNKVNFKLADQTLKTVVAMIKNDSKPIVEDIFEDLYDQLQKKRVIQSGNIEKADSLRLKDLSKLQKVLKKHFRNLYNNAQSQASTEVKKAEFAVKGPSKDDFLDFLEKETFKYIGDWEYNIRSRAKQLAINAIKDGDSLASVLEKLDIFKEEYSETSIERYARTKATEVFNRGRMEYFEDTGIVAAYQFSAIMDEATSDICEELNGKVFELGNEAVPPLHFNCRSVLIPITKYEDYKVDSKTKSGQNIDSYIEKMVVDKGFSRFCLEHEHKKEHKETKVKPKITDPNVEFTVEVSGDIQTTTYTLNGKAFQKSIATYKDNNLVSLVHKRLDDEETTV